MANRSFLVAGMMAGALSLSACMSTGSFLDQDASLRLEDGWAGLPIHALLTRPSLEANVLAVCFDAACPEPAALLMLTARGKDADELKRSLANPASLADLLNRMDKEDQGKLRRSVTTRATATRLLVAGLSGFSIKLSRADRPDRDVHGVIVAREAGGRLSALVAIAGSQEVAMANAASAAAELLAGQL
jgi:hypothetical protein